MIHRLCSVHSVSYRFAQFHPRWQAESFTLCCPRGEMASNNGRLPRPRAALLFLALCTFTLARRTPDVQSKPSPTQPVVIASPAVLASLTGAAGLIATPAVRRAVRRLFRRDDFFDIDEVPSTEMPESLTDQEESGSTATIEDEEDTGVGFTLTSERLSAIASINSQLAKVGEQLEAVPVFTAAVGNGSTPLMVSTCCCSKESSLAALCVSWWARA